LRELERGAADLDREPHGDVGEHAEISRAEHARVDGLALDDFLTLFHSADLLDSIFSILSAARPSCSPIVPSAILRPSTRSGTSFASVTGITSPGWSCISSEKRSSGRASTVRAGK